MNEDIKAAFYDKRAIQVITNLSQSTINRMMERGEFPHPVRLSPYRVAWRRSDVDEWVKSLAAA